MASSLIGDDYNHAISINPLSANPKKGQIHFVSFDHFVGLALKGLNYCQKKPATTRRDLKLAARRMAVIRWWMQSIYARSTF